MKERKETYFQELLSYQREALKSYKKESYKEVVINAAAAAEKAVVLLDTIITNTPPPQSYFKVGTKLGKLEKIQKEIVEGQKAILAALRVILEVRNKKVAHATKEPLLPLDAQLCLVAITWVAKEIGKFMLGAPVDELKLEEFLLTTENLFIERFEDGEEILLINLKGSSENKVFLYLLGVYPGKRSVKEIAQALKVDESSVRKSLKRLKKERLIKEYSSERPKKYILTKLGQNRAVKLKEELQSKE